MTALEGRFNAASDKLRSLPQNPYTKWTDLVRYVQPGLPFLPPAIKPGVLETVQEALLGRRQLRAVYHSAGASAPKERILHPLALIQHGARSYLLASSSDHDGLIQYALHRFQSAELLAKPAKIPKGFALDEFLAAGGAQFGQGATITLRATVTDELATILRETPIVTSQSLCHKFCLEAFPDTKAAEWNFVDGHGPATRSWAAMDIHHQSHSMNLMGNGGPSEIFTPFVRITNSYNGTRALRIDVGFLREHCSNGVIFEQEAATLVVPHTRQGIHSLKVARPFEGMGELREKFRNTLAGIRGVAIGLDDASQLVRSVSGWPKLSEEPKDWEKADQSVLDADLDTRLQGYFQELGGNAYAAFNTLTDLAARPPQSPRFRRDRPTLERRAGAWLRDFHTAASRLGFSISGHLVELAGRE